MPIVDLKDSKHRTAPFVVPLSTAAIELLKALPRRGAFLFPTAAGQPISDQAILYLMRRLQRRGDWQDPITGKPVDDPWIPGALSHLGEGAAHGSGNRRA